MNQSANSASKHLASISLDLDNQWSYMKIHGDAGWESFPSYFDIFVPHVLDLLARHDLKITFFVVGRDAALDKNREYLREIAARGHEIGNHSFNHESWLQKYSKEKLIREIESTEAQIATFSAHKPVGFRGPGFSWSPDLLEILAGRDYLFDASTLPTYIGPLARMYYFWKSDLSKKEKEDRSELFGSLQNGFRSIKPYQWQLPSGKTLMEIPVSTIPLIKTPFHLSYLLYLSRFSTLLMRFYLNLAITMCKLSGLSPSYLLHPLDLIGGDKLEDLAFFPGMDLASNKKAEVFNTVISTLCQHFNLVDMSVHARRLKAGGNLRKIRV